MEGFKRAQQEYESHLFAPYDKGGALYDYEEEIRRREEYAEIEAERMVEEIWLNENI